MYSLKTFLVWYLGLKTPETGEGTTWRFDWRLPAPAWILVLGFVAILFLVSWIYRRDGETLRPWQRFVLIGLRTAVFVLIVALLTELSLIIERTGLPSIVVMVDVSASMSLRDSYPPSSHVNRLIAKKGDAPVSGDLSHQRLELVQSILTKSDGAFLDSLKKQHDLLLYRFADSATQMDLSMDEILALKAESDQTRPAPSVHKVLSDLRGTLPAAIVLFTDGIATVSDSDKLSTTAEGARRKGVQLHVVGVGRDESAKDVQLFDTLVDDVAFVDDPILFTAKLKSFGFEGKPAKLQLRKEGSSTVLVSKDITLPKEGTPDKVELSYTSNESGEFDFVLELVPLSEESNNSNNQETRHISVREEKIRVLLADGIPRYEFRYLKQLLEREASLELSTLLQDSDLEYASEDRTAISHFPVKREELNRFDVLILGDLQPSLLGSTVMESIRDFVTVKGGSVVFIAGTQANPAAYGDTPLESLLPFVQSSRDTTQHLPTVVTESFRPLLTVESRRGNRLFRLGDSEADSERIWNELPSLYWFRLIPELKPAVRVLAEHPTVPASKGRAPIIVLNPVGAGTILFHATDETWRWRFRTGDLYFGRYWIQAIRYLSRSRLIGKDRTAELNTDQLVYRQNELVTLRVRFADEKSIPNESTGVTVMLDRKGEGRQEVTLSRMSGSPTLFEAKIPRLAEGTYHAWISSPSFTDAPPATDFRVEVSQRELMNRGMDREDMVLAAKRSHGKFYTLEDVDRLPDEIPAGIPVTLQTGEPIPLWNRQEILALFAILLTGEWLLRKRWKLS